MERTILKTSIAYLVTNVSLNAAFELLPYAGLCYVWRVASVKTALVGVMLFYSLLDTSNSDTSNSDTCFAKPTTSEVSITYFILPQVRT